MSMAAKSGTPAMTGLHPTTPVSVPPAALQQPPSGAPGASADVSVETVRDSTTLDQSPDARQRPPATEGQPAAADQPAGQPPIAAEGQATVQGGQGPNAAPQPANVPPSVPAAAAQGAPPPGQAAVQGPLPSNHQGQ